jgi:hypothetical protein
LIRARHYAAEIKSESAEQIILGGSGQDPKKDEPHV